MPKVSVIIPTYNQASFLARALTSVLAQSETDWEAIVINNCSSDDTTAVVSRFQDDRISLVNFRNNGIIAASRNIGIKMAGAEWCAFLDSDDVWHPEKLSVSLAAAEKHPGADVIAHREHTVRDGRVISTLPLPPRCRTAYRGLLFGGNCFSTTAIMIRTSRIREVGGFSEDHRFVTAEDYDLWLRVIKAGGRTCFIDNVLSEYTLHGANATSSIHRHLSANLAVLDRHWRELSPRSFLDVVRFRRARALTIYGAGRSLQRKGERFGAIAILSRSLSLYPLQLRAWVSLLLATAGSGR